MIRSLSLFSALAVGPLACLPALAAVDANAAMVTLRDPANGGCTVAGVNINNCFTSLSDLSQWVTATRKPAAATPLLVDIGPGKFIGSFTCDVANYPGYVTLRGAGMKNTTLENAQMPVNTLGCVKMHFSDMTLRNTGNLFGVRNLGGSTFWQNVEVDGYGYAWFDAPGPGSSCRAPGTHYWFNSRLTARTAGASTTAYFNACDESWFFGSEITANGDLSGAQVTPIVAVGGEVHVYGSVIRALASSGVATSEMTAVKSDGAAEIHIHGTGIDVISTDTNDVTALLASSGGTIHANVSSYSLRTGSGGTITRISNSGGHVHAPYVWEAHPTPPAIVSQDGADTALLTSATGGAPRFLVYSVACSSKWFDVGSNACRP